MTTVIAQRSIRLLGKTSADLNRQSAAAGEIFYDNTAQTLRLYNGSTVGGSLLATVSALNSLIPSQTSNSGKYLTTNGTAVSWGTITPTPVATRTSTGTITGLVDNEIALGINAGKTSQGAYAVAVGLSAGEVSQSSLAVAVGSTSGLTNQQMAAVAIGYQAGQTTQGASAIAIGRGAGRVNQAANSIVINATGSTLNNTTASSLVIDPIRSATATANVLYYNTTSKEVTYAALPLEIPTQTNNVGRILTTDGTNVSWITPASSRLKLLTDQGGSGVVHTFSEGPVWRHTNIAANFTANFIGVPAVEGTVLTVMLQLVQGVTPYMPTAVQIEGVTTNSILWLGGGGSGGPGNASKTNVVIFTLIRATSGWAVLGEVKSYG